MDKLSDDMIELYEKYFEFLGIRVPFFTFLLGVIGHFRLHISQLVPLGLNRLTMFELYCRSLEDGFSASGVQTLTERVIDLRHVPSGLLFRGGLATTWDFPGFHPIFKDIKGNGASILKGPVLTSQDQIEQHTTCLLPSSQDISKKMDHKKRVEVEDPKIVATRESKARAAAKKRERKRQGGDGGEGTVTETDESREDRSPHVSPHGSGNRYVHNYSDTHVNEETDTLRLGNSDDQSGRAMTNVNTKVVQPSLMHRPAHHSLTATRSASPPRSIQRVNVEAGESSSRGSLYKESNALTNATALKRAWVFLARGALAQTDILERFERIQADFDQLAETHSECGETVGKLVQARLDLAHISHLYTTLSDRYKAVKSEHEGCVGQLEVLEVRNSELSQVNKDQTLRIKELEDELTMKDSALIYAERLNTKRAQEREKLIT
nr:transposase (putative), gypsy type [Tanacetum cinerariifolium]